MDTAIEVRLFGQGSVRSTTDEVIRHAQWRTVKNRDLFRLLCVRDQVVPIEQVIEALWPEAPPAKGRGSLRTAIAHVRRVLGENAVQRVGGGLTAGPTWVDLRVYQARLAAARRLLGSGATTEAISAAKQAVALHTGALFEDDPYSEWLSPLRDQIELTFGQFLVEVAAAALDEDLLHDAAAFGEAALRHDSGDERAGQIVMTANRQLGNHHRARQVYAVLCDTLANDFGVRPSAATAALHQSLSTESPAGTSIPKRSNSDGATGIESDLREAPLFLARHQQARTMLDPDEQGVLDLLAVAGHPLSTRAIARLLDGLSVDQIRHTTDTLDALGCVRSTSVGFELVHPTFAEVAYQWIRESRRRALHQRLAVDPELTVEDRARHSVAVGALETPAPTHRSRPACPVQSVEGFPGPTLAERCHQTAMAQRSTIEADALRVIAWHWPRRDLDGVARFRAMLTGWGRELAADDPVLALARWAAIDGCVRSGDAALHVRQMWDLWAWLRSHPDPEVVAHAALALGYALHELDDPQFVDFWSACEIVTTGTSKEPLWHVASSLVWLDRDQPARAAQHVDQAARLGVENGPAEPWFLLATARLEQANGAVADAVHTLALALDAVRRLDDRLGLPEIAARLAVMEALGHPSAARLHLAQAEDTAGSSTWHPRERAWILLAQSILRRDLDREQADLLAARAEAAVRNTGLRWTHQAIERAADAPLTRA